MITTVNIKGNGYQPLKCIHNTNMYDGATRAYNKRYFDTLKVRTSNHLKDFK